MYFSSKSTCEREVLYEERKYFVTDSTCSWLRVSGLTFGVRTCETSGVGGVCVKRADQHQQTEVIRWRQEAKRLSAHSDKHVDVDPQRHEAAGPEWNQLSQYTNNN